MLLLLQVGSIAVVDVDYKPDILRSQLRVEPVRYIHRDHAVGWEYERVLAGCGVGQVSFLARGLPESSADAVDGEVALAVVEQGDGQDIGLAVVDEGERVGVAPDSSGFEGFRAAKDGGSGCGEAHQIDCAVLQCYTCDAHPVPIAKLRPLRPRTSTALKGGEASLFLSSAKRMRYAVSIC